MCGKIERIHWDNAKTFQVGTIKTQCERYGIAIVPRPIRKPHYGAYVERYIGTLMLAVHLLPGTTFSNPRMRGDYNAERRAVMTMAELEQWLAHQVVGVYHNRPHKGLAGLTPHEAWTRAWTHSDDRVRLPPLIGDRLEFVTGLLPSVTRTVQRNGIALFGLQYWDPALTPLIKDGNAYRVHFHQGDLSRVFLCCGASYIKVPLLDRSQPPFALWELRDAKRQLLEQRAGEYSERAVFETLSQQREITDAAAHKSKAARRAQAKRPEATTAVAVSAVDYSTIPAPLPSSLGDVP